ncbi:MAG: TonB-dependent receptor [Thermodesulfobacteriota bacterium]
MRKSYALLLCMGTSLLSSAALADEPVPLLAPIEVAGQADALAERAASPGAKLVIDREEIKRMEDRTVGDVLRRLPGISYSGPPGVTKDVRMRGLDKGYTQILINGERMNSAKPDRQMSVSRIPADMIERIEIIRTPLAEMDSQGVGGTINIILKETEKKPFGQLRLGAGYTDEIPSGEKPIGELGAQFGGASGNFSYLLNADVVERAENKGDFSQKFKADGSLNEVNRKTDNSDVRDINMAPRFDWKTAAGKLSLDPFYVRTNEDKVKTENKFKANGDANGSKREEEDKINELSRLRVGWEQEISERLRLNWHGVGQRASESTDKTSRDYNAAGVVTKTTLEDNETKEGEFSTGISATWLASDFHAVKLGAEWLDRKSEAEKITYENNVLKAADAKGNFTVDETRLALFVGDEWQMAEKHLLAPGMRLEIYNSESRQSSGAERTSNDVQANPSLQYRYQWSPETVLRAGVARTLKLPKFDELNPYLTTKAGTVADPDQGGTPDLVAETSIGYDAGLEHFFANGKGVAGVNLFYRDISDLIESVTTQEGARYVSRPQNVGDAELWGAELDLSRRLDFLGLPNLTVRGNYTWLDSEVKPASGGTRSMKEVPDYIANIGFDQDLPAWGVSFGAALSILGPIDSETATEVKHEDRKELLDLYVRKELGKNWQVSLTAYNVLEDDKYSEKTVLNTNGTVKESEKLLETSARTFLLTLQTRW